jgi:hypothetical protein
MSTGSRVARIGGFALLVLSTAYVAGYFALGDHEESIGSHSRMFSSRAVGLAYLPMGWLECTIRQQTVHVSMPGPSEYSHSTIWFEP